MAQERQEKRRLFEQGGWHLVASSVAFDFAALLQGTLMRVFGCPIAVVGRACECP
jgi:hypothetical protein